MGSLDFRSLVEAMADIVSVIDRDHRFVYTNPAREQAFEVPAASMIGRTIEETLSPSESALWAKAIDDVLRTGISCALERTVMSGGRMRRFASVASRLSPDLVCIVARDSTTSYSTLLLDAAARAMVTGMVIVEAPSGAIVFQNDETERVFGTPARPIQSVQDYEAITGFDAHGQRLANDAWPVARALRGETLVGERVEIVRHDGRRRSLSINATPVRDASGRILAAVATYDDITDARRAHETATYLAAAGALLERFDPDTSLQAIVDLAVPVLADWCFIHLATAGDPVLSAIANADPEKLERAKVRARTALPLARDTAVARVLAGGPRELVDVDAEVLSRASRDPEHHQRLLQQGYRSAVVAPLTGRDGVLGAVTFAMAESGRHYTDADLDMLSELARRTGIALDNARLFAAEQRARQLAEDARDRTRRLQQLTAALSGALAQDQVVATMVDAARAALGAAAGFAWLLRDPDTLELVAAQPAPDPAGKPRYATIAMSEPIPACDAVRTGEPMLFENLAALAADYPTAVLPGASAFGAWAVIPFMVAGRGVGAVSFSFEGARRFSNEDRELLVAMMGQASLALERCLLLESERRARMDLEAQAARAALADRRKDEFLAMLGHELRNPLAPITTALELMALKNNDVFGKERAAIRRQVDHMTRLVDDLLDISRITRGKIELDRRVVELENVIAKAIEQASPLVEKRRQQLAVEVASAGLPIDADPMRLAQVVQNLLTNAAKYSEPGARIALAARRDGDRVVLTVRDAGIGIAAEMLPRLFDPFVQGERALDRAEGGLGIGLTIARSLVELHGGTIAAASPGPGQGSTFTIVLPLAGRTTATAPVATTRVPVASARGIRVLVVDDNVDAATTLQDLLGALGHEVAVAHDGAAAIPLAQQFEPEVALLDIGLPVLDGYELARRLRAQAGVRKLRLIAVTGYGQDSDRARATSAGFDHHLVKPIAFEALKPLLEG